MLVFQIWVVLQHNILLFFLFAVKFSEYLFTFLYITHVPQVSAWIWSAEQRSFQAQHAGHYLYQRSYHHLGLYGVGDCQDTDIQVCMFPWAIGASECAAWFGCILDCLSACTQGVKWSILLFVVHKNCQISDIGTSVSDHYYCWGKHYYDGCMVRLA